jgi:hypothetical protein
MRFVFARSESRALTALVSTSLPRATRAFGITNASPSGARGGFVVTQRSLKCGTCQPAPQLQTRTSPLAISTGRKAVDGPSAAPLSRLDLEQMVDLRGVVDGDEVLLGHQLDLRIAQDSMPCSSMASRWCAITSSVASRTYWIMTLAIALTPLSPAAAHRCLATVLGAALSSGTPEHRGVVRSGGGFLTCGFAFSARR